MRRLLVLIAVSLLGPTATAAAATYSVTQIVSVSGSGGKVLALPVHLTGVVSVDFAPGPASGCAKLAACAYSGEIVTTPGSTGQFLAAIPSGKGKGKGHGEVAVFWAGGGPPGGAITEYALVHRTGGAGRCADEQSPDEFPIDGRLVGGAVRVSLPLLSAPTRCAGPAPADLRPLLPTVTVPVRRLERGQLRLDFHSVRSFRSHGFAGTLTSTVVATLGRPAHESSASGGPPPGVRMVRERMVSERVSVTGATGVLTVDYAGSADRDVCVLLDSCGLAGTLSFTPDPVRATGTLTATAPATRPLRDFRAALGLGGDGSARGIQVDGLVDFVDRGQATARTVQNQVCTDAVALQAGSLSIGRFRGRLAVAYFPDEFGNGVLPHARCPGPIETPDTTFAFGTTPATPATNVTVALHGAGHFDDDGYTASLGGAIHLRLHRGPLHSRLVLEPQF